MEYKVIKKVSQISNYFNIAFLSFPEVGHLLKCNLMIFKVQEVQKTETIKNSRLRLQKIKARRCPNIHKIMECWNEDGIMMVRNDIPFKKKSKPGLGESRDCKKGDMMVVTSRASLSAYAEDKSLSNSNI